MQPQAAARLERGHEHPVGGGEGAEPGRGDHLGPEDEPAVGDDDGR